VLWSNRWFVWSTCHSILKTLSRHMWRNQIFSNPNHCHLWNHQNRLHASCTWLILESMMPFQLHLQTIPTGVTSEVVTGVSNKNGLFIVKSSLFRFFVSLAASRFAERHLLRYRLVFWINNVPFFPPPIEHLMIFGGLKEVLILLQNFLHLQIYLKGVIDDGQSITII